MIAAVSETASDAAVGQQIEYESRRFGVSANEREHLAAWPRKRGVEEAVMESTARYWKLVWLDLEPHFRKLHLAQTHSNRAPKDGRTTLAKPSKQQIVRDRLRLRNHLEALLEQARIKLSSALSDLLGQRGRRTPRVLAAGETDPVKLAELGGERLRCSKEELAGALNGHPEPLHLERPRLLDKQIYELDSDGRRGAEEAGVGGDPAGRNAGAGAKAFNSAAATDPGAGKEEGSPLPERVPAADPATRLPSGPIDDCPPALPPDLEDPQQPDQLHRARRRTGPRRQRNCARKNSLGCCANWAAKSRLLPHGQGVTQQ